MSSQKHRPPLDGRTFHGASLRRRRPRRVKRTARRRSEQCETIGPECAGHSVLVRGFGVIRNAVAAETATGNVLERLTRSLRDGPDGPWSTFALQVGTPSQQIRVLPANGEDYVWTINPEGCTSSDPSNCEDSRGQFFITNRSSTWDEIGLYDLLIYEEKFLGYSGSAEYGYDSVTLGWPGNNGPTLDKQVVAGIATDEFWLGVFPLNPWPVNFTELSNSVPSLMSSLKNESLIPSLTWGYTAGAYNVQPTPVFGSLTLGGYDTTRFTPNDLNFTMFEDISRDLLVTVQNITTNGTAATDGGVLYSQSFAAYIDALVPYLWLPTDACTAFEQAFNLTWNDTAELYFISDTLHAQLLSENPTVSFSLGPSSSSAAVTVSLPYSIALDLNASFPLADPSSRYFPLKRADNSTQYTLGRAFLQSAYVIANYEYFNFSVSQALYPSSSTSPNLVSLPAKGASSSSSSSLGTGAIVGIAVAVIAILAIVGIAVFVLFRRRRRAREGENRTSEHSLDPLQPPNRPELDAQSIQISESGGKPIIPTEMPGADHAIQEKDATEQMIAEKGSDERKRQEIFELPANEVAASEFHTPESTPIPTPMSSTVERNPMSPVGAALSAQSSTSTRRTPRSGPSPLGSQSERSGPSNPSQVSPSSSRREGTQQPFVNPMPSRREVASEGEGMGISTMPSVREGEAAEDHQPRERDGLINPPGSRWRWKIGSKRSMSSDEGPS